MKRRTFIQGIGGACAAHALAGPLAIVAKVAEQGGADIKSLFKCEEPAVMRFTEDIFRNCIL